MVDLIYLKQKLFPIGLGTAQLDMDYGFDNRLSEDEKKEFLAKINESNINFIDTAPAYGNAEKVLGNFLSIKGDKYIATKLTKIPLNLINNKNLLRKHVFDSIENSLDNLKVNRLDLLLLHQSEPELIFNDSFKKILLELKHNQKILLIGVSVYERNILQKLLVDNFYDAIEINFSILDQRNLDLLDKIIDNKLIIARSIFLRGMLTCPIKNIPPSLKKIKDKRLIIEKLAEEIGVDYLSILINYPLCIKGINIIIVGMNNPSQIDKNLSYFDDKPMIKANFSKFKELAINDSNIVDPRRWKNNHKKVEGRKDSN